MSLSVKIKGLDKLNKITGKAQQRFASELGKGIKEAAFIIEGGSKKAITQGETRAIDTGRLRADIMVRSITPQRAIIAPVVKYAIFVHEGTNKLRPRPFLEKGIDISEKQVKRVFIKRIEAALS